MLKWKTLAQEIEREGSHSDIQGRDSVGKKDIIWFPFCCTIFLNGFTVHSDVVDFRVELRHESSCFLYFNRKSFALWKYIGKKILCTPYCAYHINKNHTYFCCSKWKKNTGDHDWICKCGWMTSVHKGVLSLLWCTSHYTTPTQLSWRCTQPWLLAKWTLVGCRGFTHQRRIKDRLCNLVFTFKEHDQSH